MIRRKNTRNHNRTTKVITEEEDEEEEEMNTRKEDVYSEYNKAVRDDYYTTLASYKILASLSGNHIVKLEERGAYDAVLTLEKKNRRPAEAYILVYRVGVKY